MRLSPPLLPANSSHVGLSEFTTPSLRLSTGLCLCSCVRSPCAAACKLYPGKELGELGNPRAHPVSFLSLRDRCLLLPAVPWHKSFRIFLVCSYLGERVHRVPVKPSCLHDVFPKFDFFLKFELFPLSRRVLGYISLLHMHLISTEATIHRYCMVCIHDIFLSNLLPQGFTLPPKEVENWKKYTRWKKYSAPKVRITRNSSSETMQVIRKWRTIIIIVK